MFQHYASNLESQTSLVLPRKKVSQTESMELSIAVPVCQFSLGTTATFAIVLFAFKYSTPFRAVVAAVPVLRLYF